ncbi:hypothetical protein ACWGH8_00770 [Nonomuraea muscovyensis]
MDHFYASGSESLAGFSHCIVTRSPSIEDKALMFIELHKPFTSTLQSLEHTKVVDKGADLPNGLGPGYSAPIKDKDGNIAGAKALTWTQDGTEMLDIQIIRGAPGRDHQADVVELVRQLRPMLLSSRHS